ncbi:response regulator [Nitrospirillum viridazoti]|uniref:DNA-binding response regulator n=1 Tax=Nitrospirillum viridazoti CBAmc TaxID=1441467 RepID=A0A248JZP7_9PROT|nr:response regulator transcription factor [Nitrospirillum amazonense]ASG24197.1 DNA-binding response regulator [Nitrospirillum amazonense CBAmc]TWB40805.1 LuxR family two component transcriptional regulator [Nitrospirillum amazonense]
MKLLLVDDHAIVRSGLRRLLAPLPDTTIAEAATGRDALTRYREDRPDIVLLDLNLPGVGGLELLQRLLIEDPTARVLVFSMHAEALYASRALAAGAKGYMSKNADPDELLAAIRRLAEGGRYVENEIAQELAVHGMPASHPAQRLTERDLEILRLLGEGRALAEIASELGVGYKTIANTCTAIKAKLGVARTADLIRLSIEMGVS